MSEAEKTTSGADVAGRLDGLVRSLRAMSRFEHDDLSLADEAADEIEKLLDGYRILLDASDLEMEDGDLAREIAHEMLAPNKDSHD